MTAETQVLVIREGVLDWEDVEAVRAIFSQARP
jgi:hypothetical protein